ncbi:MAG: hypothetical protein H7239_08250 [Flavobacterium sp.]|nr:hypothetical protein [Flavobacterium sp.]
MVTIVDYKSFEKENGEKFHCLVVQGGLEAVKSKQTGKTYFTAKTVKVPTTFDEQTCLGLIGEKISGVVKKVETDPYDYTVTETGEIIQLNHRYEFVSDEDNIIESNVMQSELVH